MLQSRGRKDTPLPGTMPMCGHWCLRRISGLVIILTWRRGGRSQVGKEQLGSLVHDDAGGNRLTGVLGKWVGNKENCSISPYLP